MEFLQYAIRLASLQNWPARIWFDIREIARAGLYYNGPDVESTDRLRCAFCELIVADWKPGDNVWKIHASNVPLCWHLLSCKGTEFVQSVLREEENGQEFQMPVITDTCMYAQSLRSKDLTILGVSGHLLRKQQSAGSSPSSRLAGMYTTDRGVPFTTPAHMEMVQPEKRLASFDNMDALYRTLLDLKQVVEAGFFFAGAGDSVICYYCNAGFTNWNRRDCPWVEHARHESRCMHVILTKGEEFVEKVLKDIRGEMKRTIPALNNADNGKRRRESESGEENVNKKFKVFGVIDREGVERHQPGDMARFPSTVSPARRRQRCPSCSEVRQGRMNMQESNLKALCEKIRTLEPTYRPVAACDSPIICGKCHKRKVGPTTIGSVCCRVSVCETCVKRDERCPCCGKTTN